MIHLEAVEDPKTKIFESVQNEVKLSQKHGL